MISDYINRENRDPNQIVLDFARSEKQYDIPEIARFADGIGVAFVVTSSLNEIAPMYIYASDYYQTLTGYRPTEVMGRDPSILQCKQTNITEAHQQMKHLLSKSVMELRLINRRKDGSLFGNHIRACSTPSWHQFNPGTFFGFLSECPISTCA